MASVYINKADNKGPWKGACVINDDGSMVLLGLFSVGLPADMEDPVVQEEVRNLWKNSPGSLMRAASFSAEGEEDTLDGAQEATPEVIEESIFGFGSVDKSLALSWVEVTQEGRGSSQAASSRIGETATPV